MTRPTAGEVFVWFNSWLKEPLNERDKTIIREVFHCIDYPDDVARANGRASLPQPKPTP